MTPGKAGGRKRGIQVQLEADVNLLTRYPELTPERLPLARRIRDDGYQAGYRAGKRDAKEAA